MNIENLEITGRLRVKLFNGKGELMKDSGWMKNVITTAGKAALASLLTSASAGTSWVTHMGFGTSTTTPVAADTILGAEISGSGYSRAAYTVTRSNPSGNVIQYVATLTGITSSITVQEAGLFNAASGGTLIAHQLTTAFPLAQASDSLQITWQVTAS